MSALGFSPDRRRPSKTFQGTPMRHLGVHVGNFYLVEKAGGEAFTDERGVGYRMARPGEADEP